MGKRQAGPQHGRRRERRDQQREVRGLEVVAEQGPRVREAAEVEEGPALSATS